MGWGYADPEEQVEGPIEGKAFTIKIDIHHETREKAIKYLQSLTKGISDGLTNVSDHPTRVGDNWSECFPESYVSCGWRKFEPEYGYKKEGWEK